MKYIFTFKVLIICGIISSATTFGLLLKNRMEPAEPANVYKQNGLYVFINSQPVMPYDSITELDGSFTGQEKLAPEILSYLVAAAKRAHPNCNGLIISDINFNRVKVIRFK